MAKSSFPDWYRRNRALLGALARLWFLPKKFKAAIVALLAAFDKWLILPPNTYGLMASQGDDVMLSQILIDEEG